MFDLRITIDWLNLRLSSNNSQGSKLVNHNLVELDELLSHCGSHGIDIRELTISQIREHFRMDRLSSFELTRCYLDRISQMDEYLRSVIEVNPDAIASAERADRERSERYAHVSLVSEVIRLKHNTFGANFKLSENVYEGNDFF